MHAQMILWIWFNTGLVDAEIARTLCGDEDSSISLGSYHLQCLNNRIGSAWLVARFVFNLLGALSHFQNQLIAVWVTFQKLIENASCGHELSKPVRLFAYTTPFSIHDMPKIVHSFLYIVVNNFIVEIVLLC